MQTKRATNINKLFDFASDHDEGFTFSQIEAEFDWDYPTFMRAVRGLRSILTDEKFTLSCTPQGQGERWLYQLTGDPELVRLWHDNRYQDCETRLNTIKSVARAIVNATDRRSIEGRKWRYLERGTTRLLEDLAMVQEEAV